MLLAFSQGGGCSQPWHIPKVASGVSIVSLVPETLSEHGPMGRMVRCDIFLRYGQDLIRTDAFSNFFSITNYIDPIYSDMKMQLSRFVYI